MGYKVSHVEEILRIENPEAYGEAYFEQLKEHLVGYSNRSISRIADVVDSILLENPLVPDVIIKSNHQEAFLLADLEGYVNRAIDFGQNVSYLLNSVMNKAFIGRHEEESLVFLHAYHQSISLRQLILIFQRFVSVEDKRLEQVSLYIIQEFEKVRSPSLSLVCLYFDWLYFINASDKLEGVFYKLVEAGVMTVKGITFAATIARDVWLKSICLYMEYVRKWNFSGVTDRRYSLFGGGYSTIIVCEYLKMKGFPEPVAIFSDTGKESLEGYTLTAMSDYHEGEHGAIAIVSPDYESQIKARLMLTGLDDDHFISITH